MRKNSYLLGFVVFFFCTSSYAKVYTIQHFVINSDLDSRYVKIIQLNVEAYYENMDGHYFANGWEKPLKIYYLEKQSDSQQLLNKHGHEYAVAYGCYMHSEPAVYTHRFMNNGGVAGLGTLFHEITHHFIRLNYKRVPTWFNEGLATFLGEQT